MAKEWTVSSLDVAPSEGGNSNVVKTVHWRVDAVDGDYTAAVYGTVGLDSPSGSFIAYDNLTKETVVGWAKAALGDEEVARLEDHLDEEIARKKNPPIVRPALPWGA